MLYSKKNLGNFRNELGIAVAGLPESSIIDHPELNFIIL
jgi:hypothetical protein